MAQPKRHRPPERPIGGSRHNPRDRRFERLPLLVSAVAARRVPFGQRFGTFGRLAAVTAPRETRAMSLLLTQDLAVMGLLLSAILGVFALLRVTRPDPR